MRKIVLYREKEFLGALHPGWDVYLDDKIIGSIFCKQKMEFEVDDAPHIVYCTHIENDGLGNLSAVKSDIIEILQDYRSHYYVLFFRRGSFRNTHSYYEDPNKTTILNL